MQDTLGFIWVVTEAEGLMRYDGKAFFKPEWHSDFDVNELLSLWDIATIAVDKNGEIWVSFSENRAGIYRFNLYNYSVTNFIDFMPPMSESFREMYNFPDELENLVGYLKEDQEGNVWIGGINYIFRYDTSSDSMQLMKHDTLTIYQPITDAGDYFIVRELQNSRSANHGFINKKNLDHSYIYPNTNQRDWLVWFYPGRFGNVIEKNGKDGLLLRNFQTGLIDTIFRWDDNLNLSFEEINGVYEMPDRSIWVNTKFKDSIYIFSPNRTFAKISPNEKNKFSVINHKINDIYVDQGDNYWIATEKGISILTAHTNPFSHYSSNRFFGAIDQQTSGAAHIFDFNEDEYLLSTDDNGFVKFNKKTKSINKDFRNHPTLNQFQDYIAQAHKDEHNNIWINYYDRDSSSFELVVYNLSTKKLRTVNSLKGFSSINHDKFHRKGFAFEDEKNRLYFNFYPASEIYQYSYSSDSLAKVVFENKPFLSNSYHFNKYYKELYFTSQDSIYVNTPSDSNGLHYKSLFSQALSNIKEIYEDSKNNIWIASSKGLSKLDRNSYKFNLFLSIDALPGKNIHNILEDDQGNLWLSFHESGIVKFNPETKDVIPFTTADGLKTNRFRNRSAQRDKNGTFYLGDDEGLTVFHPDSIQINQTLPRVYITKLKLFNEELYPDSNNTILQQPITLTQSIELQHDQNVLTLEYTALNYINSEKNEYAYQLEGFDKDWQYVGNKREATYTNLSPGQYTFRVKGSNNNGVWNEEGTSLQITVLPPWHQTWWARSLFGILLLGSLIGFYKWRTKAQREKIAQQESALKKEQEVNQRLQKIDQLKDQFLANTSHELRTPLHGIIGLSESMLDRSQSEQDQEDLSMIISSGKRLGNLVNDILDFSKLKNFDIQLSQKSISLYTLVDIVLKNNLPLVKGKALDLVNNVEIDLPAVYADENRLQQVLYNLVGNAIKFTERGKIVVAAEQQKEMIQVAVTDTGIGVPKNKRDAIFQEFEQGDGAISREFTGTGLGLSISKRLAELHGGQMWLTSKVGQGSTFFFTLPISTEKATTLSNAPAALNLAKPSMSQTESSTATPQEPVVHETSDIRILVVDDEPINQQVLKNHLAPKGFQITQAMNGEEAIQAIKEKEPFDLVLLDVMMPRMSGFEVCQKIREQYLISELPVIMVTAKDQLQDVVQGLSLGANDYLPKPFQKEELLARVKTQLDLHRIFGVADRFVPNEFLQSLNRERITDVALGDHTEQVVTVMFADIRGYTSLSEKMTPAENFRFVNAFNGRMGPEITKHNGFINQYLGDGIMAIFPKTSEDALRSAIDMQRRLMQYNGKRQAQNRKSIQVGIGLHTGSLIMGIIGDQNRMDAATIADTVNTASRLESLTKYYRASILLSEDSFRQMVVQKEFHFRYLGKVQVKGKKEPVGIYECINGDVPELMEQKLQTMVDFERGLSHFFAKEFPEAAGAFNQVLKGSSADYTARLFLNKASQYTIEGVAEGWTGVEVMDVK